jgi:hypothetical protein
MRYSIYYREIEKLVKEYDDKLLATDPRFQRTVFLAHEDGSSFKWVHAFVMRKGTWIIVFTEHHGYHIYDQDDIYDVGQFHNQVHAIEDLK